MSATSERTTAEAPTDETETERAGIPGVSATYDPADNKLRIRCMGRLDRALGPALYERIKAAGFRWAPKQDLFVAPAWSPEREDLLIEIAGEVGDEDTSLVERADQRAERFEGYRENRKADAENARRSVAAIADNIPFGQPILVGHHSERRARRDAEKIRAGMERTVRMWRTSEYWARRAAGAQRHARYKELPAVRARRIKGLESDGRKWQAAHKRASRLLELWTKLNEPDSLKRKDGQPTTFLERALHIANQNGADGYGTWSELKDGKTTPEEVQARCIPFYTEAVDRAARWVEHTEHRLTYERAMLEESGGLPGAPRADRPYEVGGRVLRRGKWYPISKVNLRDGQPISVSVVGHFASTITFDEVTDYRPPADGDAEKIKAATDKGPLCNYPGPGFAHMTAAEWKAMRRWSDASYTEQHPATEKHGRHRTKRRPTGGFRYESVFITDAKRVDPPPPASAPAPTVRPERDTSDAEEIRAETDRLRRENAAREAREAEAAPFKAVEQALKAGVQVVAAPQLFPTPAPLAARMVEEADIQPGMRVLEPSAGTGALVTAIYADMVAKGRQCSVTAVEVSPALVKGLAVHAERWDAERAAGEASGCLLVPVCDDFLRMGPWTLDRLQKSAFDRVVMNPPFQRGADIEHIRHALTFLAPGGRLVALCANGARQREAMEAIIAERGGSYQPLPEGSFREQGTKVRVAMVVIHG